MMVIKGQLFIIIIITATTMALKNNQNAAKPLTLLWPLDEYW